MKIELSKKGKINHWITHNSICALDFKSFSYGERHILTFKVRAFDGVLTLIE